MEAVDSAAASEESREAKWRRLIETQAASGLSVKRFCAEHGVAGASFFSWRRKLAGGEAKPREGFACTLPTSFVEVEAARPELHAAAEAIELDVRPDGQRVLLLRPGFDPTLLRQVLAALEVR
jgi:hypothetical protein